MLAVHRTSALPLPSYWPVWFEQYLGASQKLSRDLWRLFARSATAQQLYLLRQVEERPHLEAWEALLLMVLTPVAVLTLTARLSPADGRRRREPAVTKLEETILFKTDNKGAWR